MELQRLAWWREREHLVVELFERGAGAKEVQAHADAGDVGVDGNVLHAEREQEHARGGLSAHRELEWKTPGGRERRMGR